MKSDSSCSFCYIIGCAVALVAMSVAAGANDSALWGQNGERWDPAGRLADWSTAGYRYGLEPIPEVPQWKDVQADFGAVGDGVADDTQAIREAIVAFPAAEPGALYFPEGVYRISEQLVIDKPYLVIRGAGPDQTRLHFTKGTWELGIFHDENPYPCLLQFQGTPSQLRAGNVDASHPVVGTVAQPAARGEKQLVLDEVAGLGAGDDVLITYHDGGGLADAIRKDYAGSMFVSWVAGMELVAVSRVVDVDRGAKTVTLLNHLDVGADPGAWTVKVRQYNPSLYECGVEDLSIGFPAPSQPYLHHNDHEGQRGWDDGFSALNFQNAFNCWARNIEIVDADDGLVAYWGSNHITFADIVITQRQRPSTTGIGENQGRRTGHYGITFGVYANHCLADGVRFTNNTSYQHGIAVKASAHLNVFSDIRSDMTLSTDHHNHGSPNNLFTQLAARSGERLGGTARHRRVGAFATFWNVDMADGVYGVDSSADYAKFPYLGLRKGAPTFVGVDSPNFSTETSDPTGSGGSPWTEKWSGPQTTPPNLYKAQVEYLKKTQ